MNPECLFGAKNHYDVIDLIYIFPILTAFEKFCKNKTIS